MNLYHSTSVECKMRFVKQSIDIPVHNVDAVTAATQPRHRRHSDLLPNTLRCIIAGPSNCGKTNLLISLIESENGLKFENLYIYSKTLGQEKYQYLENLLKNIDGIRFYKFSSSHDVIAPSEAKQNSIFIFDDVVCDKNQENIRNFYCMGRHYGTDAIYLTQTFTKINKHLIRDNCNFIILFKQDDMNLRHVYNDYNISCDMPFEKFREFCHACWREKYGFVTIDLDSDANAGRYRKGFNNFLQVYKTDHA